MKRAVILGVFLIFVISLASASYSVGNLSHSIETDYGPSMTLRGWVNMSFNKEPGNSMFTDSLGNSISLLSLLRNNTGFTPVCNVKNCSSDYEVSGASGTKTFTLDENETGVVGFQLTGNIIEINSLNFNLTSSAGQSCKNQVEVDLLNDGKSEVRNTKVSSISCSAGLDYGCFNSTKSTEEYDLSNTVYCQKINLTEAPGFKVGAWVKRVGAGSGDVLMVLHNGTKEFTSCTIDDAIITSSGSEVSCVINYSLTGPREDYICIFSNEAGQFKIRGNDNPSKMCGFYGTPVKTPSAAYQIFAEPRGFGSVGTLEVKNNLSSGESLSSMIRGYIINRYGSLNCTGGCVIPMKVKSNVNGQSVTLNGLALSYRKDSGPTTKSDFNDITEIPPKIDMGFQKIYFDNAKFFMPSTYSNITYEMSFDGDDIFEEEITITKVPTVKDVYPDTAALGYPITIRAEVEKAEANITDYEWDFDGDVKRTTTNQVIYTFGSLGKHNLTVTVKDKKLKSSSSDFVIEVLTPETQINKSVTEIRKSITSIKAKISTYPVFTQTVLREELDLANAETIFEDIEKTYKNASTESDYLALINKISSINLPKSVELTETSDSLPFFPSRENIDLGVLESVSNDSYDADKEEQYVEAVLSWNLNNVDVKVSYDGISGIRDTGQYSLVKVFEITVGEKAALSSNPYLVIRNMENLKFKEDYGEIEDSGYYFITLEPGTNSVVFSTTEEEANFVNLPAFVSPKISELKIVNICEGEGCESKFKWLYLSVGLILLIIIAYFIYALLYNWYKNKYEAHLFTNRNNLFNLVTYINSEKINGVPENEILKNLKKAKWNSEQITYAMRKYAGKRTGMFELPLLGLFIHKKPMEERMRVFPGTLPMAPGMPFEPRRIGM
jgi:hypothetical protein